VPILRAAINDVMDAGETRTGISLQPMLVFLAAYDLWDLHGGRRLLQLIAQRERDRGALMGLWLCLHNLAYLDRWAGELESARRYQEESWVIREAIGLGQTWKFPGVEVNALLGLDNELREAVTRLEQRSDSDVLGASVTASALSLAVNALSRRRYDDAFAHALFVYEEDAPVFGNQILPDLVEAATRSGNKGMAQSAAHRAEGPGAGQWHGLGSWPALQDSSPARVRGRRGDTLSRRCRTVAAREHTAGPGSGAPALRRMAAQGTATR
jgi:hypothetical protein